MNDQKNSRPAKSGPSWDESVPAHHQQHVGLEGFHPARCRADAIPSDSGAGQRFHLLYSGPLSQEHGIELLADAVLAARERDPRLHLVLVGGGPAEGYLRERIGDAGTLLGWLDPGQLAPVYAGADLLVVPSGSDPFGRTILEAQASGLPVLAVDRGAASELIEPGRSGCLVAPDTESFAAAIRGLARRAALCERLATGGLLAARRRPEDGAVAPATEAAEAVARAA